MKNEKMIKTVTVLDKLLKILQVLLICGGCLLLAGAAATLIFRDALAVHTEQLTYHITFGSLQLTTQADALSNPLQLLAAQRITLFLAPILFALTYMGIRLIRQILAPMKAGEPFRPGTARKLRKLAVYVCVAGGLRELISIIASAMLYRAYNLSQLFNSQVVTGYTMNNTIRVDFLVFAGLLLLLSYIFRYGELLQQEADETL